ncbi:MAG: hypothetical protein CME71_04780 [Halobacteriovorax sp.]|nr:hypothetical protein [Halobacteriovorax sp.]
MMHKNNRVDFVGFTPDAEQKWLVEAEITKLLDRAPGQSSLSAVICSEAEGFSAKIQISSFSNNFEAYSTSIDLYGVMNKIDTELGNQFAAWKRERFRPQVS